MFCNGSRGPRAPPGQRNRQQAGRTLKTSSAKRSSSKKATGKPSSATKRASSRPARSGASREHGFWPNVRKGAHNVGVGLDAFADGEREKQKERMKEQQQARRDLQKSQLRGDPEPQIAPNLTEMFILVNRAWKELKEEEVSVVSPVSVLKVFHSPVSCSETLAVNALSNSTMSLTEFQRNKPRETSTLQP